MISITGIIGKIFQRLKNQKIKKYTRNACGKYTKNKHIIYIYIYYLSLFGNFDLSISEPDLQKIYYIANITLLTIYHVKAHELAETISQTLRIE